MKKKSQSKQTTTPTRAASPDAAAAAAHSAVEHQLLLRAGGVQHFGRGFFPAIGLHGHAEVHAIGMSGPLGSGGKRHRGDEAVHALQSFLNGFGGFARLMAKRSDDPGRGRFSLPQSIQVTFRAKNEFSRILLLPACASQRVPQGFMDVPQ